jgi:hypothetical protein
MHAGVGEDKLVQAEALSSVTLCCRRAGHRVSRTGAKRHMSMEMHAQAAEQWSGVGAATGAAFGVRRPDMWCSHIDEEEAAQLNRAHM